MTMSMRRWAMALAIAILAASWATPAAGAKTKIVVAGGPPSTAGLAGSTKFPKELDLNGFYRRQITVNVGDSVRWLFSRRVVHTVTFLRPGQKRPPLEVPDPTHPYTGILDTDPSTPPPASANVTFTTPGSFVFECTIHPGMEATIKVT
jgi:plastocyanin